MRAPSGCWRATRWAATADCTRRGGGFIAYPGWRIAAHGTQYNKSGTTLCTTWGAYRRIKATAIYAY
ncbi:hypothetical protein GCM10010121_082220 [Streptomyces brasiliensis]|uniref:Uncharacterized protein n=1 Tax=Streptomyces brasiliensis TaxID=1954 RepID=A0A917LEU4_9ACTN|nr:hypothetical protein GCM10010121_082220 [Streptomyces brasiliensis]